MLHGHRQSAHVSSHRSISFSAGDVEPDDSTYSREPDYLSAFYPHMLAEDVANGIMPSSHHHPLHIAIEPQDPLVEQLIADFLSSASHRAAWGPGPLADALVEFMHDCAFTIMTFGEAAYELVYLSEPKAASPFAIELRLIHPRTLDFRGRKPMQRIPRSIARKRQVAELIEMEADNVLIFRAPTYIRASFGTMLAALATPQLAINFSLFQQSQAEGSQRVPYEIKTHARTEHLAVAEATRQIGWNARNAFEENIDEYYLLDRHLRFEQFKIELRDTILATLNEGLVRAGRRLKFSGQIRLSGLLTLDDLQSARTNLAEGNTPFKDVLAPFLWY